VTDGTLLRLLLMQEYDTYFGFFDHNDENLERLRPLAAVALHEQEKVGPHSAITRAQTKFVKFKIRELTGMSFTEFHAQPRDVVETWYALALEAQRAPDPKANAAERVVRDMEQQLGKPR
jgi:hypothetical protein